MEKKIFTVSIDNADNTEMEKLWYEYNASKDIIAFLMKDDGVKFNILQEYINVAEVRYTKCEMMKAALANKYKPDEVDLSCYDFGFDFDDACITFTQAK